MRIFHDFGMKALAVGLAVILWLALSAQRLEQVSVRTFDIPVALVAIPRELILLRATPDTVSVRLRGRLSALRGLSGQNMEATINLSEAKTGNAKLPITAQALNVPGGVEVLSIDPARIDFFLEPRRQKMVRIQPYLVGELPPGYDYVADEVTVDPPSALISGPASVIADVNEVATERVILSGRSAPFRQRVAVVADTPLVRVVEPMNTLVNVPVTPPPAPPAAVETATTAP